MSAATWTTKDGRTIKVAEMSDEHLVNTIRMLRRKGFVSLNEFGDMCAAAGSLNGEMAQDAAASEIAEARVVSVFDDLLAEAEARGLEVDK